MSGYTLDDFVAGTYQDLPAYVDCGGLDFAMVRLLHQSSPAFESEGLFGQDHAWFVHLDVPRFNVYVYEVNRWNSDFSVFTVDPFVKVYGTTYDGLRATWFADTGAAGLLTMASGLLALDAELKRRGWYL